MAGQKIGSRKQSPKSIIRKVNPIDIMSTKHSQRRSNNSPDLHLTSINDYDESQFRYSSKKQFSFPISMDSSKPNSRGLASSKQEHLTFLQKTFKHGGTPFKPQNYKVQGNKKERYKSATLASKLTNGKHKQNTQQLPRHDNRRYLQTETATDQAIRQSAETSQQVSSMDMNQQSIK